MKLYKFAFICICAVFCIDATAYAPPTTCANGEVEFSVPFTSGTVAVGGNSSCPAGTIEVPMDGLLLSALLADTGVTYDDATGKYEYTDVCVYRY